MSTLPACPLPIQQYPHVLLAHGRGGRLTQQLINAIAITFASAELQRRHDSAALHIDNARLAFTTDSYVVQPLFFPGGDMGKLAIYGTMNDLAMCGARPLYLSVGFILEEGLPMETLARIVQSMKTATREAGVEIVTGDTKVVDRGKGDGLFLNTADRDRPLRWPSGHTTRRCRTAQRRHRAPWAIMAAREGLAFETTIESDCAPLATPVLKLLEAGVEVHCLRDLTRGGLAAALIEIAQTAGLSIRLDEATIPRRAACLRDAGT